MLTVSAPAVTCFIRLADPCVIPTIKPHGPCSNPWNGNETKSLRPDPSACAKPPGDPSISNDPTTQPVINRFNIDYIFYYYIELCKISILCTNVYIDLLRIWHQINNAS